MKEFVLWGSSGHAKVLADVIGRLGGTVVQLFDNSSAAVSVLPNVELQIGVESFRRWAVQCAIRKTPVSALAAIGGSNGQDRLAIHELFREYGFHVPSVVHSAAAVSQNVDLGPGTQVLANALVAAGSKVGEACILNHGSQVDHECEIADGCHLAPRATLCGCIRIGRCTMIGAGAVVLPRLEIGSNTIIGAGSVVTRNVPSGVVAFGNPAKVIRNI